MTQPIQEPTTQRSISQGKWGENQLFRRPAPPSGDDRPWARVSKPFVDGTFYPNQTIPNNDNETIDFDVEDNLDSGDSGFDYFDAVGGPPVNAIEFLVSGLFAITAEIYWFEAASFPFSMSLCGDGLSWRHRTAGYFDTSGAEDAMATMTMIHRYEANDAIQLCVYQRSGGNRTIQAAYMEVVYLGSFTGTAPEDMILPQ